MTNADTPDTPDSDTPDVPDYQMLAIPEVAKVLQVSPSTLRGMLSRVQHTQSAPRWMPPMVKVGRKWVISRKRLERFICELEEPRSARDAHDLF